MIRCIFLVAFLSISAIATTKVLPSSRPDVLTDYVQRPDSSFRVLQTKTLRDDARYRVHHQKFVSQTWLTKAQVDHPEWAHDLIYFEPKPLAKAKATKRQTVYLHLSEGDRTAPVKMHDELMKIMDRMRLPVVELRQVLNQPLQFGQDGVNRYEDDLVAFAWDKFLKTGNPVWLPRLPMLKASVRAMDLIEKEYGPCQFVVGGISKRGWVAWLLPLVDKRVAGIIPTSIDLLNIKKSFAHHHKVYKGWSPALRYYERSDVTTKLATARFEELASILDPYRYIDQLRIPKLVMAAGNDQFFCPDSSQFYFSELAGPKGFRVLPNTGHYLPGFYRNKVPGSSIYKTIAAFVARIDSGKSLPNLKVQRDADGTIHLESSEQMNQAILWHAHNAEQRDFRMMSARYPMYLAKAIRVQSKKVSVRPTTDQPGWHAFFLELRYGDGLKLTTEVWVESTGPTRS